MAWRPTSLFPEKVAVQQGEQTLTYSELEDRTCRVANLLHRLGIGRGDRVMLLLPNDFRLPEVLLGAIRTGGVAVPTNVRLGDETLGYIAGHSDAAVVIVHAGFADRIPAVRSLAPAIKHVLTVGGDRDDPWSYDALLDATSPDFYSVPVDVHNDVAIQLYTSGSTGRPKGVLLSHAGEWWQARASARAFLLDEQDVALSMAPLYHANALWLCLMPMLYGGGTLIIVKSFEPSLVLQAVSTHRPTYTSGTPSMFAVLIQELRKSTEKYDLSSLRFLLCGSSAVPEDLMREIEARFGCEVSEVYGLSEGGTNVQTPRWGLKKSGSCGLPMPDVEIRIADAENPDYDCSVGAIGELWSRCPANALGYFKQPEATAEKFTTDGWLKTGDMMRSDEQGYIYFCGRRDDMISVGGENVYPKEIEAILLTHPNIVDASVVSVPHHVKGEAPVAWVVQGVPESLDEDAVQEFFLARGPAYAHPRRVFFIDSLPVSGTNKVDRRLLTDEARRLIGEPLGNRT